MNQYPFEPGYQAHSETSRMAAESVDAKTQLKYINMAFLAKGFAGATCWEIYQDVKAIPSLKHIEYGTVSARMVTLKKRGTIIAKGERAPARYGKGRLAEIYVHKEFAPKQMTLDITNHNSHNTDTIGDNK